MCSQPIEGGEGCFAGREALANKRLLFRVYPAQARIALLMLMLLLKFLVTVMILIVNSWFGPSRQHLGLCPWLRLPCVDLVWNLCGPCVDLCPWLWLPCVDTKSIRGEKRFSAVFNFTLEPEYSKSSKSYNIQNNFSCTTWTLQCELFGVSASCPQCCISASIPSTHKCNPEHVLWLKLFTFLP